MAECFKCGKELSSTKFFDVVSNEGLVKICPECQEEEDLPVIRKPTTFQLKEAEVGGTVYERLSNIAGVNPQEHLKKFHPDEIKKQEEKKKQEVSLRSLVDQKFKEKISTQKNEGKVKTDLIHNFHWVVMQARRRKKITRAQLAKEIGEAESAIKMVEQGNLPEDDYRLIRKIEVFLGIKLVKSDRAKMISPEPKDLFEGVTTKDLTIGDLKDMKSKKDTDDMIEEFEEEVEMNKEGKKGFFGKIFGRRKKGSGEVEEDIVLDEDVDFSKDVLKEEGKRV